ncbi:hypothetical protein TUSST3_73640 [Streptomyces sp. TUS-ST3]|nr:hypothetical protein TUSST3_73640 [Streptomyces sp. TUS-ST3]
MPSVTVTSTGLEKAALVVPFAGVTETTAFLVAACTDAVAPAPCEASAELPHPVSRVAAGTAPSAARIPRRDHLSDRSDEFDMCGTPTARLPEMSTFAGCILRRADVVSLGIPGLFPEIPVRTPSRGHRYQKSSSSQRARMIPNLRRCDQPQKPRRRHLPGCGTGAPHHLHGRVRPPSVSLCTAPP